jgi:glycerol kinase
LRRSAPAIARLARAAHTHFIESRQRRADREIARVLRVRVAHLPSQQPCNSAELALNLRAARRV